MRGRALFLPVFTAAAVLLAVSLPMGTLQQWDRSYQDVLHQESVDEDALVTNYTLSGSDRLHLLRYSGISARNGEIHYENPVGSVSVEVRQVESIASMEAGGEKDVGENSVSDSYLLSPMQGGSISEHVNDYLFQGVYFLVESGVISNDLLLHYQKAASQMQVEYCSITDDSDPFFSMSLLCICLALEDGEAYGLEQDTRFSVVLDEETGVVYALSIQGEPDLVLTQWPYRFSILADLIGVSCTEYKEIPASGAEYPNARFNFGGYSYCLEQAAEAEGGAFLNFNLDSD